MRPQSGHWGRLMAAAVSVGVLLGGCAIAPPATEPAQIPSISPIAGPLPRVSSAFGAPRRGARRHEGIDLVAPRGTPVVAAADGRVSYSGRQRGYGNMVVLDHGRELQSVYAHLARRSVRRGMEVRQGQRIGSVGASGNATAPHLHYEVRRRTVAVDPIAYLPTLRELAVDRGIAAVRSESRRRWQAPTPAVDRR